MSLGRVPARARWRFAQLGLRTVLGFEPQGFFIPYRHAAKAGPASYPALRPIFVEAGARMDAVLGTIERLAPDLDRIATGGPGLVGERPARFGQTWFPRLDAAAAYALVRDRKPRRIVEIGSGHSSRFMAQAIVDGELPTDFLCIDPRPRAPLNGFPLRHEARLFQRADAEDAARLEAGDILFIDSSHIGMPGTDVDLVVLDVLPRLASGVLVHFHDIFLPDDYPPDFGWRGYNEHLAVGALLIGGAFSVEFSSVFVRPTPESWLARQPLPEGAYESSLWLRKTR